MGVFLGLLLTVNNSLLDFEETLKLSLHSKKAFQGQFVCSENEGTDCDFFGKVLLLLFFFSFHGYIYISIAYKFLPYILLYIH